MTDTKRHECQNGQNGPGWAGRNNPCGTHGSLCDMCKEDRADKRATAITTAIFATVPGADLKELQAALKKAKESQ